MEVPSDQIDELVDTLVYEAMRLVFFDRDSYGCEEDVQDIIYHKKHLRKKFLEVLKSKGYK